MKKTETKLYNVIFPIWLLWLFPLTWLLVFPANFVIDLLVLTLTMKRMGVSEIKENVKNSVFKVWLFGFAADLVGTAGMLLAMIIDFDGKTPFGKWWYHNITNAVCYDPFSSVFALLWIAVCAGVAACFIYLFNFRFSFRKTLLDDLQKKKLSLSLAVFTAPYFFFLPTKWFLRW